MCLSMTSITIIVIICPMPHQDTLSISYSVLTKAIFHLLNNCDLLSSPDNSIVHSHHVTVKRRIRYLYLSNRIANLGMKPR